MIFDDNCNVWIKEYMLHSHFWLESSNTMPKPDNDDDFYFLFVRFWRTLNVFLVVSLEIRIYGMGHDRHIINQEELSIYLSWSVSFI